jgi:PAS domain S-box-containing protein
MLAAQGGPMPRVRAHSRPVAFLPMLALALGAGRAFGAQKEPFLPEWLHPDGAPLWFDIGEVVLALAVVVAVYGAIRYRSRLRPLVLAGESRYLKLVESAPFGVVVHHLDRVIYVNEHARHLFGLAGGAETQDLPLGQLAPAAEANGGEHPFATVTTSTTGMMPIVRIRRPDGSLLEAQTLTINNEFRGSEARLTFIRDMTVEMATQRELHESRERLAVALEAARDGVWDLDLATGRLGHNATFGEIIAPAGEAPADLSTWRGLIHPGDRVQLEEAIAAHERNVTNSYECEMRIRLRDGSSAWILEHGRVASRSDSGAPLRLVGTVRDITIRKRAERRLEMRSRLAGAVMAARGEDIRSTIGEILRDLLDTPYSCVGMFDRSGRLRLNCNCREGAGGASGDVLLAAEAIPGALQQVLASASPLVLEETGTGPDAPHAPLLGIRLSSGDRLLGLISVGGRPGGFQRTDAEALEGFAEDLGPLIRARLETEAMDAQLAQAQKTEALGVLAGGIAHDFNNILQAVMGFSSLARQDAGDPARLADDLDRVQKATVRGHDLVQRILQFSRSEEPEMDTLDPVPLVQETARDLAAGLPAHITLDCRVAPECGRVRVGLLPMRQILRNLTQNARQAMETTGGRLTIVARPLTIEAGDGRFPREWFGRDVLEVAVADTGPGIPEAHRSRLFDPFFTTREVGQGSGLGLSVVHGLVTAIGGVVHLDSPASGGTIASVFLLRVPLIGRTAETDDTPVTATAGAGKRVLFVDDEDEIRELAVVLLGRAGFVVETASDGFAAAECIRARPGDFDVVVTDQYMPGLSGSELARRVAAVRPGLPVVLVTGMNEIPESPGAGASLFREVVTKPFTGTALVLATCRAAGVAP